MPHAEARCAAESNVCWRNLHTDSTGLSVLQHVYLGQQCELFRTMLLGTVSKDRHQLDMLKCDGILTRVTLQHFKNQLQHTPLAK